MGAIPATSEKYGNYCLTIAKNILGSAEDAEECVNDTYLNVWNAIPPAKPVSLSAFLGKVTRNLSLNLYKKTGAVKRGGGQLTAVLDELSEIIPGSDDVQLVLDQKELAEAITAFLATLSAEKRGIFVCRYWYTDSVLDIAGRYGMSAGAVSMILGRVRKKLRKYLIERGFEL